MKHIPLLNTTGEAMKEGKKDIQKKIEEILAKKVRLREIANI
jgi:hypothetical protein